MIVQNEGDSGNIQSRHLLNKYQSSFVNPIASIDSYGTFSFVI